MMPGETPPVPAGTAAVGGACANCGVLQQVGTAVPAALEWVCCSRTRWRVSAGPVAGGKCRVSQSPLPVPAGAQTARVGNGRCKSSSSVELQPEKA